MVGAALVYMENTHTNKKVKIILVYSVFFSQNIFLILILGIKAPVLLPPGSSLVISQNKTCLKGYEWWRRNE